MPSSIPDRPTLQRRRLTAAAIAAVLFPLGLAAQAVAPPAVLPPPACAVTLTTDSTVGDRVGGALRSGDLLKIAVFRNKELSGDYLIDSQGRLVVPGLGEMHAAGVTPGQVENGLRQLLACQGIRPDVSVQAQIRVSVLGEVRNPGVFPVDPGVTLLQLLTAAGGETQRADLSHATVIRGGKSYPVNLQSALGGGSSGGIILNSNDVLVVPKRGGFTREDAAFALGAASALVTVVNLIVTLTRH